VGLQFTKLELDIYDVFDPHFQSSSDLFEMKNKFSGDSQVVLLFNLKNDHKARELCLLSKWIKKIERFPEVHEVNSIWTLRRPEISQTRLLYKKQLQDPCTLNPAERFSYPDKLKSSHFRHLIPSKGNNMFLFDVVLDGSYPLEDQVEKIITEAQLFLKDSNLNLDVHYLGNGSTRYYFKKILFQDSLYNLLVIFVMIFLLRFFYGTWRSGLYLTMTLIASGSVLYGFLALLGGSINILTNNLFLMTAVAGAADFIFVTHDQLHGDYEKSFLRMITPCFFTTLTTIVGFLSLNTSDLSIIKQFGNGAALGALCEWAMMFLFLPSFLKVFGLNQIWVNPSKAFSFNIFNRIERIELPRRVLWGFFVLMSLSIPAFFFLNDQDSPVQNLPNHHPMRVGHKLFKENFQWESQAYIYFPKAIDSEKLKPLVTSLSRLKLIHRIETPIELIEDWTNGLPLLKKDLITRDLSMTPLWERYFSASGELRLPIYLSTEDLHSLRSVRDKVNDICEESCRLAGQRVVYLEYGEKISKMMIESFAVSIFLVSLILFSLLWLENKVTYFLPLILSALMGPLAILTLLALFQIPVTIVTSIFLAVMVGLAGDNAIQFLFAGEDNLSSGIEGRARSSIIVTVLMMAGSSMFLFQSLFPLKIMGALFIFGFFINLIGDLWGLKKLLK
jgi:predicted RND superfamily exporter protein